MKNGILFTILCCTHLLLATNEIVPLLLSLPVALAAAIYFSRFIKADWGWMIQMLLIAFYFMNGPGYENVLILVCSALLFYYSYLKQQQLKQYELSKTEVHAQLQQFNETFQTVRKERHDYMKHVAAIAYMLDKDDVIAAKDYMGKLLEKYEETNVSIKGEQGAVASVLHTAYQRAKKSGIIVNYQLEVPVSSLAIPVNDQVELLGNLLENAVDACEAYVVSEQQQAFIELSLRKRSGLYILSCVNSTLPVPQHVVDQLFVKSGVTTKEQHEGLGTAIIQQIVHKHNGFLDFVAEKNTFTVTCKLPNVL